MTIDHTAKLHHPKREEIELAGVLQALSDPHRLELVRRLAEDSEPRPCGTMKLGLSKSTMTHHFRTLREAGVIEQHRDGTAKLTSLRREDLNARFPGLLDAVLASQPAAVQVARTFVHREHRLSDPAFLRDERQYLNRQWGTLHLMERQRDQLVQDIEEARALASQAGINPSPTTGVDGLKMLAVIGIGNRFRRDDGAGLEVARRLRLAHPPGVVVKEEEGEPKSLIDAWSGVDEALVIDAISSGSEPGTLHRYEVNEEPLPSKIFRSSTHAVGLAEAIELGRSLGRLPGRLVVFAIEGKSFEAGEGLTAPVQQVVADLVMDLYHELSGAS